MVRGLERVVVAQQRLGALEQDARVLEDVVVHSVLGQSHVREQERQMR